MIYVAENAGAADEYQRLKRHDRQVLTLSDFTEADITALKAARAPESPKAFDHELHQQPEQDRARQ